MFLPDMSVVIVHMDGCGLVISSLLKPILTYMVIIHRDGCDVIKFSI